MRANLPDSMTWHLFNGFENDPMPIYIYENLCSDISSHHSNHNIRNVLMFMIFIAFHSEMCIVGVVR